MIFDSQTGKGALIQGTTEELESLRDDIAAAIEDGQAEAGLVNKTGITPLIIRCDETEPDYWVDE